MKAGRGQPGCPKIPALLLRWEQSEGSATGTRLGAAVPEMVMSSAGGSEPSSGSSAGSSRLARPPLLPGWDWGAPTKLEAVPQA